MGMTFEQKGAYLELLLFQFNNGKFTEAQAKLVLSICSASAVHVVLQKFDTDGTFFWKQRLTDEMDKRRNFSESRRNNAKSKKTTVPKGNSDEAYAQHMENENRNENEIIIGIRKECQISILKKYANDKTKIIYDLSLFFASTGQLEALQRAGWIDFDGFMRSNPSATFNDDGHVYNSFRKYHEGRKNGTKKLTYDDVK